VEFVGSSVRGFIALELCEPHEPCELLPEPDNRRPRAKSERGKSGDNSRDLAEGRCLAGPSVAECVKNGVGLG